MKICETLICRYYKNLPAKSIFTTRDCLKFGETRGQVDQVLYCLVKNGEIIRLARGVFTCAIKGYPNPTDLELAIVKARSFGKKILDHCEDEASRLGFGTPANISSTYIINGCSSSFKRWNQNVRIYFRTASAKKMHLQNTNPGKVVRALWHMGQDGLNEKVMRAGSLALNRIERQIVVLASEWMPWWLMDELKSGNHRHYPEQMPPSAPLLPRG